MSKIWGFYTWLEWSGFVTFSFTRRDIVATKIAKPTMLKMVRLTVLLDKLGGNWTERTQAPGRGRAIRPNY